jgi:hypothetical protein
MEIDGGLVNRKLVQRRSVFDYLAATGTPPLTPAIISASLTACLPPS